MQSITARCAATSFIAMTMQWIQDKHKKHNVSHATSSDISHLTKELEQFQDKIEILNNHTFQSAKNDFIDALRWNTDHKQFKIFIDSSHELCRKARNFKFKSYDKIFFYSLWISVSFIYFSDYGQNHIKGLKGIYNVLIDINNDIQLKNDLISALKSKLFWTKDEQQLIYAVIHFSIRSNIFITKIIDLNSDIKSLRNKHSGKLDHEWLKYCNKDWIPAYYNGYYFGKTGNGKNGKFIALFIKDFRKLFNSEKEPHRIKIDDLMIHTFDYETGIIIQLNEDCTHHWYNGDCWSNLSEEKKYNICVKITNNGKMHIIDVHSYTTILQIKRIISKKEGNISPAMLKVLYNKQKLQNIHSLFYYNITDGKCLFVSMTSFNPLCDLVS